MRGATSSSQVKVFHIEFQSTLLMRGATWRQSWRDGRRDAISIHAPHARSDTSCLTASTISAISIHAPHARSDDLIAPAFFARGISIHAPHARSDVFGGRAGGSGAISIHAPHARSDLTDETVVRPSPFQSTLLMRGATDAMVINPF